MYSLFTNQCMGVLFIIMDPQCSYKSAKSNMLNHRFFESSGDETSSTASPTGSQDNTTEEVWKLIQNVKDESCLADIQEICRKRMDTVREKKDTFIYNKEKQIQSGTCYDNNQILGENQQPCIFRYSKIITMAVAWILCTIVLIAKKEKVLSMHQISVPPNEIKSYWILQSPNKNLLDIHIEGAFLPDYYANLSGRWLDVWIETFQVQGRGHTSKTIDEKHIRNQQKISDIWTIPVVREQLIDIVPDLSLKKVFPFFGVNLTTFNQNYLRIQMQTNLKSSLPVSINCDLSPIEMENGVVYAALVLLSLYVLIIFEVVHRTLAAMLASTASVAILAFLDERPTVAELASWIDFETVLLLFSMMVLVAIFSETGIFDYLSVYTYKITNGRVWPLINTLCIFTIFFSSFLDNVTTALLMTPVTIRLCEVSELNPVPVLMAMMIFANLGGVLTPVGDPPNVIVASHPDVIAAGVDFGVFFIHMFVGISFVGIFAYIQLRFLFKNNKVFQYAERRDVLELRHEIATWQRAAASLSSYSKDEDVVKDTLLKKVRRLLSELKTRLTSGSPPYEKYTKTLEELKNKYPIKDKTLLIKSGFALFFVIVVFFLHAIPELNLSLGCTAFMGALLLLILADRQHLEGVLARVEWSTLLFFSSLFILMEALTRLRLIEWIGRQTEELILSVDQNYRLSISILLILWVSALVSAFVDNIPLTTMMIHIVTSLSRNPQLSLPLMPLVWSLCYGACIGGIATLIGSSSNVVCAGVAEQHGYRFSFIDYSKIGLPVTFLSLIVISIYMLVAHVVLGWNN